jgi:hypothetical protein
LAAGGLSRRTARQGYDSSSRGRTKPTSSAAPPVQRANSGPRAPKVTGAVVGNLSQTLEQGGRVGAGELGLDPHGAAAKRWFDALERLARPPRRQAQDELGGDALAAHAHQLSNSGGSFEPKIVGKRQTRWVGFDERVLALYARGLTVREGNGLKTPAVTQPPLDNTYQALGHGGPGGA